MMYMHARSIHVYDVRVCVHVHAKAISRLRDSTHTYSVAPYFMKHYKRIEFIFSIHRES